MYLSAAKVELVAPPPPHLAGPELELKALLALNLTGCSMSESRKCHESLELEAPLVPNLAGCPTAAKAGFTNEKLELEATLVLNLAGAGAGCSIVRIHAWQASHT